MLRTLVVVPQLLRGFVGSHFNYNTPDINLLGKIQHPQKLIGITFKKIDNQKNSDFVENWYAPTRIS